MVARVSSQQELTLKSRDATDESDMVQVATSDRSLASQ